MHRISRPAVVIAVILASTARAQTPAPRSLTLDQALAIARDSNSGLRALRQRVEEAQRRSRVVFSNYLPRVSTQGAYVGTNNTRGIIMPAGALGTVPGLGNFPATTTNIQQGGSDIFFAMTTGVQPITPYFKVREGLGVTRADESVSRAELKRSEQAVAIGVMKAYGGVLIAAKRRDVARARIAAASLRTNNQNAAVQSGLATTVAATEARLRTLQARQDLLEAENEVTDLSYALADAIGLPGSTPLAVEMPAMSAIQLDSLDIFLASAMRANPDVLEGEALVDKATHGVGAAKAAYIPDIGLFGGHFFQSSFPFFPRNTLLFGAIGSVNILDFGARSNTLAERKAQLNAANRNLDRVRGRVRGEVEAAYRKLARSYQMAMLAGEALALRGEALRLRVAQAGAGYGVPAEESEADADRLEAELNVLRAQLGYLLSRAELEQAAGRLAR
jgi:outer membrane protein TolC